MNKIINILIVILISLLKPVIYGYVSKLSRGKARV